MDLGLRYKNIITGGTKAGKKKNTRVGIPSKNRRGEGGRSIGTGWGPRSPLTKVGGVRSWLASIKKMASKER